MICFYAKDIAKKNALLKLCRDLHQEVRLLSGQDADKTVGELTGIKATAPAVRLPIPALYVLPEIIIFSGLSDRDLDTFLAAYRTAGIAPTPLKAVVTMYNCNWTLYALTEELRKEDLEMHSS